MNLLTVLLFAGLGLIAFITYLTIIHLHEAEITAYRKLVAIQREWSIPELSSPIHRANLEPSGFFRIGAAGSSDPVDLPDLHFSVGPEQPLAKEECA